MKPELLNDFLVDVWISFIYLVKLIGYQQYSAG